MSDALLLRDALVELGVRALAEHRERGLAVDRRDVTREDPDDAVLGLLARVTTGAEQA